MNEETYPTDENEFVQEEPPTGEPPETPAHEPPTGPPAPARRSPWTWVGLAVLVLLVAAVILVFALDLPGRLTGRLDAAAAAIPADNTMYFGINLLQLTPARLDRIVKPFTADVSEAEFKDTAGMLADLDQSLEEQYGFNFTSDIQPWVGQYLGVGITGDFIGSAGFDPEEAGFILAIEARDRGAADAFLDKLRSSLVEKSDQRVDEQEYQGVTIYTHEANELAFARSKRLVLFAPRLEDVQAAIDAQRGDSLSEDANFKALSRQLPGERLLTFFVKGDLYQQLFDEMSMGTVGVAGLGQISAQMEAFNSIGASLAIVDEGLRMDAIVLYNAEKLTETQRTMLQNTAQALQVAEVMPADTLLLVAGQGLNNIVQMYSETLGDQMGADYEEAMQMLEAEIGFNPSTDLLAHLEGEYGLAVVSESNAIFTQLGVPLGVVFVSRISDHDMLENTIQKFNRFAGEQGVTIKESDIGEDHIYILGDPFMGEVVFIGLGQDHFAISLTRQAVENVFDPGKTLAKELDYQEIWTHFSKDTTPVFYLKLPELLEALRGSMVGRELESFDESIAFLNPVTYIAMGTNPLKDDQVQTTLTVFIEKAE